MFEIICYYVTSEFLIWSIPPKMNGTGSSAQPLFVSYSVNFFSSVTYDLLIVVALDLYKTFGEISRRIKISSVSENQGFCVADFTTLSDERRSRSKIFLLFNMDKRTLRSKIYRAHTFENSWDFTN